LLARAMTQIANAQTYFTSGPTAVPDVIVSDGSSGWKSGVDQSLLVQITSLALSTISLDLGGSSTSYSSWATASFAWTSQMAQQTMQENFSPALVGMFDGDGIGTDLPAQGLAAEAVNVAAGESISIGVTPANSSATELTQATQATLSSPYGFADFVTSGGESVRIARPVAVAETTGNAPGSYNAIVRMRQDGQSDGLSLQLYVVDDYNGTVAGLSPGDTGYGAAAKP
jgi:hypothetical protein